MFSIRPCELRFYPGHIMPRMNQSDNPARGLARPLGGHTPCALLYIVTSAFSSQQHLCLLLWIIGRMRLFDAGPGTGVSRVLGALGKLPANLLIMIVVVMVLMLELSTKFTRGMRGRMHIDIGITIHNVCNRVFECGYENSAFTIHGHHEICRG